MNKKTFSIFGIIASAVIIVFGIAVMTGSFGGNTSSFTGASSVLYDSGYGTFGADFYTMVNNNAAKAAGAVETAVSNQNHLAKLLTNGFGLLLISIGLIGICGFGVAFAGCVEKPQTVILKEDDKPVVIETKMEAMIEADSENSELQVRQESADDAFPEKTDA